jgi:hypothetical protein
MEENEARDVIVAYDRPAYLRHAELSELVAAFAKAYPRLCSLESVGRSPEGREIWALTVTAESAGRPAAKPALLKPAILIEGNIHAGEVTASATALYTVKQLLEGYGRDREVTALLDRVTFYVVPRLAVDGAEFYLTTPNMVRSSPLPYPEEFPPAEGLLPADLDGDGCIRLMRKRDPLGAWKISPLDDRVMVKRQPDEFEGTFFHVFTEGFLQVDEGREPQAVRVAKTNRGLDFNRNFPAHWSPEARQPGSGRYPLDQAETRALADFMLGHPNINIYLALHTSGGVLLRPPSLTGDEGISPADLRLFEALGNLCQRTAGYPCKSSHFAFFHTPGQPMTKGSKDWAYEHLGLIGYTMELWDLDGRAGAHAYREIGAKGLAKLSDADREYDELKRLQWQDQELNGEGFLPWCGFDHPQLGDVEIGGWDDKAVRQNVPLKFLKEECRKVAAFALRLGFTLPRLALGHIRTTKLPGGAWRVEAEVQNQGYLGTATTKMAMDLKAVKPVLARIALPEGAALVSGRRIKPLGQLEGFSAASDPTFYGAPGPVNSAAWAEWVVDGPAGAEITVTASHQRAGEASRTVRLGIAPPI